MYETRVPEVRPVSIQLHFARKHPLITYQYTTLEIDMQNLRTIPSVNLRSTYEGHLESHAHSSMIEERR